MLGKLTEYLKLLPSAIPNAPKIIEGFINNVKVESGNLPQDEIEEIARRRMICAECPFMSKNAAEAVGYQTSRTDEFCIHCGCPITTKTASLSSNCGIEYYNKLHETDPLPLLWTAYKKEENGRN